KEELNDIIEAFSKSKARLMCGFNRRFAPLSSELKKHLDTNLPVAINYRVNAGIIPAGHWIHDVKTGGGRILGECCHFIDYCAFLSSSMITKVSSFALADPNGNTDSVVISLSMENGSVASISYFSNGNRNEEKENIEIYS